MAVKKQEIKLFVIAI